MPSSLHEALLEMFRFRPALAVELLTRVLGVDVPPHDEARLDATDLADVVPTEFRADGVVVLSARDGPVLAVVVEVQLRRDPVKRLSWPVYVATLRSRLGCPVDLLVVSPVRAVAKWCARPIDLGLSGSRIVPVVMGPDLVPVVTDPVEAARMPEMAVLSALAHGGEDGGEAVLAALLPALMVVEDHHAFLYLEIVHAALPTAARRHLEALMATQSDEKLSTLAQWHEARGEARGETRGEARAVLAVLDARGVELSDEDRTRIEGCSDRGQLDRWIRQSATAESVKDLI